MNNINEEMQMRIFDLLEGNLSKQEAEQLLQEIENNEGLKTEYVLLSKTYLTKEHIVFDGKESLMRNPGWIITVRPLFRYAAAVAFLALAFTVGYQYFTKTTQPNNSGNIVKTQPIELPVVKKQFQNASKDTVLKVLSSKKYTYPERRAMENKHDSYIPVLQIDSAENQIAEIIPIPIIQSNQLPPTEEFQHAVAQNIVDSAANTAQNQTPIPFSRKRSLSYKLMNSSRKMIANLQLPQVHFSALKNNEKSFPKIQMKLRTGDTEIIATLID